MRHHNSIRKFGREAGQRKALLSSLASNMIEHRKVRTTEAKAKELRPFIETLVTKAKENKLSARRLLIRRLLGREDAAKKLIDSIAPSYKARPGGYTRIIKLQNRLSDGSPMAVIEFV